MTVTFLLITLIWDAFAGAVFNNLWGLVLSSEEGAGGTRGGTLWEWYLYLYSIYSIFTYVYIHTCTYIHIHIYVGTHTHRHTQTHTHRYIWHIVNILGL